MSLVHNLTANSYLILRELVVNRNSSKKLPPNKVLRNYEFEVRLVLD
jgi:hypothetical protein